MWARQHVRADVVLIAGPTASGKSAVAARLARDFDGAVINADSMQVYLDLQVISARPAPAEMLGAPHYLYGFVPAAEAYSVGKWLEAVRDALASCRAKGLRPIVTGGTGLYFSALTKGLSPVPEIHAQLRVEVRQMFEALGPERFHAELSARDPVMAERTEPTDAQRMIRAYEVFEATGVSLAEWQEVKGEPVIDGAALSFVLKPVREWLYHRIDQRFDLMVGQGALDEVRALREMNLAPDVPILRALGVPQLMAHLNGDMTLEAAIDQAKMFSRRYAKRQMTWFRHQMPDWPVIEEQESERLYQKLARNLEGL
jgi:tRNA dimethylallyltransferase